MRIIACFKVFNEEDYIKEAIEAVLPYVDQVIVADCCFGTMQEIVREDRVTREGLSGDRTRSVIKSIQETAKIERWDLGYIGGDQTIVYNKFVGAAEVGDCIWLIDGDEVYDAETADTLTDWMRSGKYHAVWLPSRLYWHDFKHLRPDHGKKAHQRMYIKLDESAHYVERNLDVRWLDDENCIYGFGLPPKTTAYKGQDYQVFEGTLDEANEMWYHHYAYVRSTQRMLEKTVSQYLQNEAPLRGSEWEHCKQFRDPIEFKIRTHPWFSNDHSDEITGAPEDHPLKDHPRASEIWDEGPVQITYEEACGLLREKPVLERVSPYV